MGRGAGQGIITTVWCFGLRGTDLRRSEHFPWQMISIKSHELKLGDNQSNNFCFSRNFFTAEDVPAFSLSNIHEKSSHTQSKSKFQFQNRIYKINFQIKISKIPNPCKTWA